MSWAMYYAAQFASERQNILDLKMPPFELKQQVIVVWWRVGSWPLVALFEHHVLGHVLRSEIREREKAHTVRCHLSS